VPLPIRKRKSSRIEPSKCFQCLECLEHTKVIETQAIDLKLQEEALMLDFQRRGEALQNQADELRLQQNRLNKATQDHKKAVKKAQEQQAKCANYIATSYQRKRTNGPLQYTNIK
jgi:selenocysteine-specific translation elongation factor